MRISGYAIAILLCGIIIIVSSAAADTEQKVPFIKGVVVDAKNRSPLMYANIVLREQPSVRVDENDNVTLRGSANFTVLVNGRPGLFQGSDALRQIPANLIESIRCSSATAVA